MLWGEVLLFGATLSTLPPGQCTVGAFPTPTAPCSVAPAALHPHAVGEAAGEDREQQQVRGVPTSPRESPRQASGGPWVGSYERMEDAQGNTGLRCL